MSDTAVAEGKVVSIHYTLRDDEGSVLDSSQGGPPMMYLHGAENIVPGLEKQLTGQSVGDKVEAVVPPAEGYGERRGPGPQQVPRSAFPEDADLEVGMQVMAQGASGDPIALWLVGLAEDHVLVDTNHPLAGVTLHFEVEITGVRAASEEELEHGHPHGPGGAHG